MERGHLRAGWVAGDDAFGMSPSFQSGMCYLPGAGWPLEPAWTRRTIRGAGVPESPSWWTDRAQRRIAGGCLAGDRRWRRDPRGRGAICSAQRVRVTRSASPARWLRWAVYRRNLSSRRLLLVRTREDTDPTDERQHPGQAPSNQRPPTVGSAPASHAHFVPPRTSLLEPSTSNQRPPTVGSASNPDQQ